MNDVRYAEVLSLPSRAQLRRRMPPLLVGLVVLGFAIACSIRADLGVAPWDVLHQGLAETTGLSFGTVVVGVGLVVLLAWIPLRQRAGLGTVVNTLSIGFLADFFLWLLPEPHHLGARSGLLAAGLLGFGIGGGLYIGAGLGPGPRDGLMTALVARGHRVWVVRTVLELGVLVIGFALGGTIGVGTVLIAFALGPLTHAGLRRFHLPIDDRTPEVLGE